MRSAHAAKRQTQSKPKESWNFRIAAPLGVAQLGWQKNTADCPDCAREIQNLAQIRTREGWRTPFQPRLSKRRSGNPCNRACALHPKGLRQRRHPRANLVVMERLLFPKDYDKSPFSSSVCRKKRIPPLAQRVLLASFRNQKAQSTTLKIDPSTDNYDKKLPIRLLFVVNSPRRTIFITTKRHTNTASLS